MRIAAIGVGCTLRPAPSVARWVSAARRVSTNGRAAARAFKRGIVRLAKRLARRRPPVRVPRWLVTPLMRPRPVAQPLLNRAGPSRLPCSPHAP